VTLSAPKVRFESDPDLDVGVFGIATRMVQAGRRDQGAPAPEAEPGATMVYKPAQEPTEAATPAELGVEREVAYLQWDGEKQEVTKRRIVIGRSKDCDIRVSDPNVSRRHAELRQEGATYWLVDLDSTNGIEIGGRRHKRVKLENGTHVTLGSTELVFHRELR